MSHSSNYASNQARGDNGRGPTRGGNNPSVGLAGQNTSFTSTGSHDASSAPATAVTSPENRHSRLDLQGMLNPTPARTPDRPLPSIPPISQLTGHSPTQPIPPITQIAPLIPRRRSAAHFDDGFEGPASKRSHPQSPIDGPPSQQFLPGRPRGSTLPRLTSPQMSSSGPLLASHAPFPGATELRRLSTAFPRPSHPSQGHPLTPQAYGRPPISSVNASPVSGVSAGGSYPSPIRPPSAGPPPNPYANPSHYDQMPGPGHPHQQQQSPYFSMPGHGPHPGYDMGMQEGVPPLGIHVVMDQTGSGSRESNNRRARNAEASARFRSRRRVREKEKEEKLEQMEQEIASLTVQRNHLQLQSNHYRSQRDRYRDERDSLRSLLQERGIESNFPHSPDPASTPQPEPLPTAEEIAAHQASQPSAHHRHMSPESEFRSGASTPMESVHRGRHGSVTQRLSTSPRRQGSLPPGRLTPQQMWEQGRQQYNSAFPPPPPPPAEFGRRLSEAGRPPQYPQEHHGQMQGRDDTPRGYSAQSYRPGPQPGSQSSSLQNSPTRRHSQQNLHGNPR